MSITVAVIFVITWVINNYNIQTKLFFRTEPYKTYAEPNQTF